MSFRNTARSLSSDVWTQTHIHDSGSIIRQTNNKQNDEDLHLQRSGKVWNHSLFLNLFSSIIFFFLFFLFLSFYYYISSLSQIKRANQNSCKIKCKNRRLFQTFAQHRNTQSNHASTLRMITGHCGNFCNMRKEKKWQHTGWTAVIPLP